MGPSDSVSVPCQEEFVQKREVSAVVVVGLGGPRGLREADVVPNTGPQTRKDKFFFFFEG